MEVEQEAAGGESALRITEDVHAAFGSIHQSDHEKRATSNDRRAG
jgi:hypothetical protein